MNTINYDVYKNTVKKADGFNPVTSEKNYTKLCFRFRADDDWEKCSIISASFWMSNDNIIKSEAALKTEDLIAVFDIPEEFSGVKGNINVGLVGIYTDDQGKRVVISTNIITIRRNTGAIVTENANYKLYEDIIALCHKYFNGTYTKAQVDELTKINVEQDWVDTSIGVVSGSYINMYGAAISHTYYEHTEKINCAAGDSFKVTSAYYGVGAVLYGENDEFLGPLDALNSTASSTVKVTDKEITIPESVNIEGIDKIVTGIVFNNNKNVMTFNLQNKFIGKTPIVEIITKKADKDEVDAALSEINKKLVNGENPLAGKTMYADGDSVAEGEGNNKKSYADMIAEKYGMSLVKKAVGGTNLAMGNNIANSIYERVTAMTGTYDYILLEGGFNDVFHSVPLGELTTGYFNDYDTTTVIGAVEGICEFLVTNYFESKKLFVLGHRKFGAYAETQKLVWNGIISALEKWGIPYVDISRETNLSAWNTEIANKYFKYSDTLGQGDGTHPNQAGYEEFYVPTIESKIKSLSYYNILSNGQGDYVLTQSDKTEIANIVINEYDSSLMTILGGDSNATE